jgi:PiT family inorganic phosphate transporter
MGVIVFIVIIALVFDFTNGAHDAANSTATIVTTGVLSKRKAVVWAASFNFIAILFCNTGVAKTMGTGLINLSSVTPNVILAGLLGAIIWNLLTWAIGFPSSSSHALMGAYAGSAIAKTGGFAVITWAGWKNPLIFLGLAPLIGIILGVFFFSITNFILKKVKASPDKINYWSKRTQFVSASAFSLGHGLNDAQKTMGIIAGLLFSSHLINHFYVPVWVMFSAFIAMGLGTLVGGWKIVHTMGTKITKNLSPLDGTCAETASAISLFVATSLKVPVSTTHVITSAIAGVGAAKSERSVNVTMLLKIIFCWLVTIPASALLSYGIYYIFF